MKFQKIADIITPLLPEDWSELRLYCQVEPTNYEIFFFVKVAGTYIQNFELENTHNITRKEMRIAFKSLFDEMKLDQKDNNWNVATLILNSSGQFKFEFDFDIKQEEITVEYKNKWKIKYLD